MNARLMHRQLTLLTTILAILASRDPANVVRVSKRDVDLRTGKKLRMKVALVQTVPDATFELRFEEEI